jgi:hypothetical protein
MSDDDYPHLIQYRDPITGYRRSTGALCVDPRGRPAAHDGTMCPRRLHRHQRTALRPL